MLNSKLCTSAAVALLGARSAPAAVAGRPGPHDDASGRIHVFTGDARVLFEADFVCARLA